MRRFVFFIAILITILILPGITRAEVYSNGAGDPTIDLIKRILVEVGRPIAEIKQLSYAIKKVEIDYNVNPVLLIAVMEEEIKFSGFPQAHVFQYNVDNGFIMPNDQVTSLPGPYSDVDRVARALAGQLETFPGDPETAVAAYFFGTPTMKSHGVEELDDSGKLILQSIFDFIRTHPDERKNATPIVITKTPKVAKHQKPISRSYRRNPNIDAADMEFSSIEEKYVKVMRYFNKKLDEKTADEIYWAIAALNEEYPHVDARLVMALVAIESSFRPNAVSCKGAQGLGQLMPYTADSLNVGDPFDCFENIRGTYLYLDREIRRWQGHKYPLDLVLAAYNAGPDAVKKAGNDIPSYKETQQYVRKVINIYRQLLLPEEIDNKLRNKTRYYTKSR